MKAVKMNENELITLRVSQEQLNTVLAHLQIGRWCEVHETVASIIGQASPQLVRLAQAADAAVASIEASAARSRLRLVATE
jgi:hypothetical protein